MNLPENMSNLTTDEFVSLGAELSDIIGRDNPAEIRSALVHLLNQLVTEGNDQGAWDDVDDEE